jgi:uncharacterized membrane protein YfcA
MPFDSSELLLLLFLALGSYIQATTGFAFGLIVMASVSALGLAPIEVTAFLISALSLLNSTLGLRGGHWRVVNRQALLWFILPCLPATLAGLWVLGYLGNGRLGLLQMLLGLCIILSSLLMMVQVEREKEHSGKPSFLFSGVLSGLMGGMFATFGPPITFMMYRQPDAIATIRATLLCAFSITAVVRLSAVLWMQSIDSAVVGLCLLGAPIVIIATLVARHYRLPLSDLAMRRFSFGLLMVSGLSLAASGL